MVNTFSRISSFLVRLTDIPVADPDDSRRRRLLNIILLGTILVAFFTALIIAIGMATGQFILAAGLSLISISFVTILGLAGIYTVNRYLSGRYAGFLFLLFLMVVLAFSDTIPELVSGRSIFLFVLPIIISSVVLGAGASFIFYALVSVEIILLASIGGIPANIPALTTFLLLALLSWLSSRNLEQALRELRTTNANLDKLVTERTQALAEALSHQRAEAGQRQAILNSIADGVIVFDVGRKSMLANPAIQGLLEMPMEQIVTKAFDDLVQVPNISLRDQSLLRTMMETKTQPSSFRVQWGRKTLSVSAAQVYGAANEEIGTVAVFRDVTREAELERMKSSFIAMVSHELRTPLSAIMGFAEMLKEGVYGPVSQKQAVTSERIMSNARHMLGMVGDLLDQAQIEAGKLRITAEPFRPAELLKNVLDVMDQIVAEKGLTLTGEVDPRLPELLTGDPQRLQQILMNLVNNGVKFTDAGDIHIRLCLADSKHWGLEVKDTGHGIPQEELERIFDAFHQVDTITTREQRGFGLGLSIVKQLVQLMRGEIQVQSALGGGSTFTITLPLVEEDLERKQAMSHSALIVEDDADLATIFAEALKSGGFETQVIRDGAMAQRRIREIVPQIVILDLHLPHVDGSTLLAQIRADVALKGTIVIVATADAVMGEIYRDVADIVLIKPISFVQLRDLSSRLRTVQWSPDSK